MPRAPRVAPFCSFLLFLRPVLLEDISHLSFLLLHSTARAPPAEPHRWSKRVSTSSCFWQNGLVARTTWSGAHPLGGLSCRRLRIARELRASPGARCRSRRCPSVICAPAIRVYVYVLLLAHRKSFFWGWPLCALTFLLSWRLISH